MIVATNSADNGVRWAWHIWISDTADQTIDGVSFMDRNLGALWKPNSVADVQGMTGETAAQSAGFYYQWGRPVPMPGARTFVNTNTSNVWETANNPSAASLESGQAAYALSIDNIQPLHINKFCRWTQGFTRRSNQEDVWTPRYYPMAFVKYIAENTDAHSCSWANNVTVTKNSSSTDWATWDGNKKTKFDPCPQGYRIPSETEISELIVSGGTLSNHKTAEGDYSIYGSYIENFNDNFMWFANAGCRAVGDWSDNAATNAQYRTGQLVACGFANDGKDWRDAGMMAIWFADNEGYGYSGENSITAVRTNLNDNRPTSSSFTAPFTTTSYSLATDSHIYSRYFYIWGNNNYTRFNSEANGYRVLPAGNALNVRCVKMEGQALSVASMSAASDEGSWK